MVAWLRSEVPFPVTITRHGDRLAPGTVHLAPDGHHLEVDAGLRARLTTADPVGGFRPSANVMFGSLARGFGPAAIGVVLTGMGRDGLDGLTRLHASGGRVLAQDEQSSVVFGMPGVVASAGVAEIVAPVEELAAHVATILGRRVR
jgi:two-component system chemotaxis response regulator CheB